jgi:hypothetical protein
LIFKEFGSPDSSPSRVSAARCLGVSHPEKEKWSQMDMDMDMIVIVIVIVIIIIIIIPGCHHVHS